MFVGGGVGTAARYLVGLWLEGALGGAFPFGTLAVNVAGCFLIGALMHIGREASRMPPTLLLMLTTGFMGGFTTYSAYCWETLAFVERGAPARAIAYVATTVIACAAFGALGHSCARRLVKVRPASSPP